jgi:hypothetical protein
VYPEYLDIDCEQYIVKYSSGKCFKSSDRSTNIIGRTVTGTLIELDSSRLIHREKFRTVNRSTYMKYIHTEDDCLLGCCSV